MAKKKYNIGVIDTETDPFKHGRVPKPFCCEFYSEDEFKAFWGADCITQLLRYLKSLKKPYYIFAHNGGKFDFHFLHSEIENPVRIINGRIVSAALFHHTLRDSYAILPVPLRDYEKEVFDYSMMERPKREKNKPKILSYLHSDCVNLFNLVTDFIDRFGLKLTIGSTAMSQIRKRHEFKRLTAEEDKVFRRFYYGGRVQCFKSGIIQGPFKVYDVNSMYPFAMKSYMHPVNGSFVQTNKLPPDFTKPYFLRFIGRNDGALPCVAQDGSLSFEKEYGEFLACSHELEIALHYKMVQIDKILECHVAQQTISFGQYVDDFFALKIQAEIACDKALRLFAKLLLNSGYGKFGQNPENFKDYMIVRDPGLEDQLEDEGYSLEVDFGDFELWSRNSVSGDHALYDVSIAASITSASRALLLDGLRHAKGAVYCDTDSIICESFSGRIDDKALGAWKLEKEGRQMAIAGKKLYALYDSPKAAPVKIASKGGTLELGNIIKICRGGSVKKFNMAPTFSLSRPMCESVCEHPEKCKCFINRTFRMTIDPEGDLDD